MNKRQRYAYLDLVKCIAMVCVCLYHFPLIGGAAYSQTLSVQTLISRYFRLFDAVCVPLFMMVNGALLLNEKFDFRKHVLRTAKLFVGVYVWYVITQMIGHAAQDGAGYVISNLPGILYSALFLYEYDGVALNHLWFVQMLVAVYVLLPLLRAALETQDAQLRRGFWFFVGVMGVLCFLVHDFDQIKSALPVLRHLDLSCLETMNPLRGVYGAMLVYFILGGALHRHHNALRGMPLWMAAALIAGGSAVLFAEWIVMTKKTEMLYDIVYYGYNCLPTLAMSTGVFALAARLEDRLSAACRKLIDFVGRNTLAIYYTHWILGLVFLQDAQLPGGFPVNLLKALAMVLIGALIGEGMRRLPLVRHLV